MRSSQLANAAVELSEEITKLSEKLDEMTSDAAGTSENLQVLASSAQLAYADSCVYSGRH